jgi:probable rRNA maturation factor
VTSLVEGCPLDEAETQRIVATALAHGGRVGLRVGVVFAADELMVELHGEYLDDPTPTDVITFDLGASELAAVLPPEAPAPLEAELYVGVEEARRIAEVRGVEWSRELALYVTHGVLHLCGFDDHSDEDSAAMRRAEVAVMRALGYPDDALPHHM